MSNKKFIVGLEKLGSDGQPSLDQWKSSYWLATCTSPIMFSTCYDTVKEALDTDGYRLVEGDAEIDGEWREGFEATLATQLVDRALVDHFSGIAVFEAVAIGREGKLRSLQPRRFYIYQIASVVALYMTDNFDTAWSAARKLAEDDQATVAPLGLKKIDLPIAVPGPNATDNTPSVGTRP